MMVKGDPRLRNLRDSEKYISSHIDESALGQKIDKLYTELNGELTKDNLADFKESLTEYIAKGGILDERGKRVILKQGILSRGYTPGIMKPLTRWRASRVRKKGDSLDNTITAFGELYDVLKSGKYSGKMKDLEKDVELVSNYGGLDLMIDILGDYGVLKERKYYSMKKHLVDSVKEGKKRVVSGIEEMVKYKAAAVILEVFGAILLIYFGLGSSITANAIGSGLGVTRRIFGVGAGLLLMVVSFLIFRKLGKHKKP